MEEPEAKASLKEEDNPPPPLCVFCSAPWTDDMMKIHVKGDFDWGYYPGEFSVDGYDATIDVHCESCKRLVYRKEIRAPGGWDTC